MSENYDLARSSKKLGKLYPILKDKHGNVIDGFHRQNADPEWPSLTLDSIDTPVQLEVAKLAANYCRRTVPQTELANRLAFLVKEGMKVPEIAEQTGISEATIYRHLPPELKARSEAISEGRQEQVATATSLVAPEDLEKARKKLLEKPSAHCSNPGCLKPLFENEISTVDGLPYCLECAPAAHIELLNREKAQKRLDEAKKKPTRPTQVESYADKVARMHRKVSEMDTVQHERAKESSELRDLGWKVEFQKEYVVVICKSDLTLARSRGEIQQEIAVFWDGEDAHPEPEEDEKHREWAKAEQGQLGVRMEVFTRRYKTYSPALADKLWNELIGFVKELDKWDEGLPTVEKEESE